MSGDELDLDAIEARHKMAGRCEAFDPYGHLSDLVNRDVPALVAEVRRLRARDDRLAGALIDAAHRTRDIGARSTLLALSRHLDADALDALRHP